MAEEYNLQEIIAEEQPQLKFDSLPIWKLVLFDILSWGWYPLAWFYTQNKALKKRHPLLETIFYPYTCFWLFPKLNNYFKSVNKDLIPAGLFACIVLLFSLFIKILDRLNFAEKDWAIIFPAELILSVIAIIPLIISQCKINQINKELYPNKTVKIWSWKSTVFIIIAIPLWFLIFIGYLSLILEFFGIITFAD